MTRDVTVRAANVRPTAAFTANVADLVLRVDGSGSADADGTIASYAWSFGDGATAAGRTPAAHAYAVAGTYAVTLTVTDDRGDTGRTTRNVTVTAPVVVALDSFTRTLTGG